MSLKHCGGSGLDTAIIPTPTQVVGSADTDIMFIPSTNKITLTNQHPLLRAVIQEAFENLRASLLFNHGFPNANVTPSLIRVSLIAAAETHSPKASQIHLHLLNDHEYMEKNDSPCKFYDIEITLLTDFSATRSYSPLPRGDQRLLQCDYTCLIFGLRFYPVG